MKLKLPPYSKPLNYFLNSGKKPKNDIYFFCGWNAWEKAKAFSKYRFTLVLPPYEVPFIYKWPVNGCDVLVFEGGNLETRDIEEIAFCLLKDGAAIVRAVNANNEIAIYRKEAR